MWLLDTHVWVWAATGESRRLGGRTRRLLERAQQEGAVRVSAISIFEIVALHACGRLRLSVGPEAWVRSALDVAGLRVAEVSADAAIDAGAIPRDRLPDPLDRLILASAARIDATLVTADARILDYAGRNRIVRTHDASK